MLAPRWRARREALLQQPQGRDLAAIHVGAIEPTRARLTWIQRPTVGRQLGKFPN